jgi:hypothetical protein
MHVVYYIILLELFDPEDEGAMIFWNMGNSNHNSVA